MLHVSITNACVVSTFTVNMFIYCSRLGDEYASIFAGCLKALSAEKMTTSIPSKRFHAKFYMGAVKASCDIIRAQIFQTKNRELVEILLDALLCMKYMLGNYARMYSRSECPDITRTSDKFFPVLLQMRQWDCFGFLTEISLFADKVKPYFATTQNIRGLNEGIKLAFTYHRYLQDIILRNSVFSLKSKK